MDSKNPRLIIVDHPYVQELLTILRDRDTPRAAFRTALTRIGEAMGYEIARRLRTRPVEVTTPLGVKAEGRVVADEPVIVVVLRAALPFAEGIMRYMPRARMGFVAARRVEEKGMRDNWFDVEINYMKIPELEGSPLIIADPMVATGSTMVRILKRLPKRGETVLASVIATPLALARIREVDPSIVIYTAAVDGGLNDRGYIVPGLGDAGDRALG